MRTNIYAIEAQNHSVVDTFATYISDALKHLSEMVTAIFDSIRESYNELFSRSKPQFYKITYTGSIADNKRIFDDITVQNKQSAITEVSNISSTQKTSPGSSSPQLTDEEYASKLVRNHTKQETSIERNRRIALEAAYAEPIKTY